MIQDKLDNSKIEKYSIIIRQIVEERGIIEEADIEKCTFDMQGVLNFSNEEASKITKKILEVMGHHLDKGTMITAKDHKSWYQAKIRDLPMKYTERNREYLKTERGFSSRMVSALDDVTSEIMDGFGNPDESSFKRVGLVMGDVQSGKTNTYTTLCCKAADVGYKVIILLTGTLETLRKQTQVRLDEGFVGRDSVALMKKDAEKYVGVGKMNPNIKTVVFTNSESDFNSKMMRQLGLSISSVKDPILLVTKKNKDTLGNLYRWLKKENARDDVIDETLLMIDDEADNASVNTSYDNVTKINGLIRDILRLFTKTTYVGFTATPYANIFISPDQEDDLYPRDFIYSLKTPDNYIGPEDVYGEGARHENMLRVIEAGEDGLTEIPYKHNKDFKVTDIPDSLNDAINCFIISCAIRDLRGDTKKHMSMLVNVSRFTNVQEDMKELIVNHVFNIKESLEAYSALPETEALTNGDISSLKATWIREYKDIGYEWDKIQRTLNKSVKSIVVRTVNQRNGAKNLNYRDNPDGLRLIAIGGDSLSRGLTLEGLSASYFYRRSKSYDTLMQMGRWFGYREGYSDLCRIFMTQESIDWYAGISDATEELKFEFEIMRNNNKTPADFGLLVRNDINGLCVTARNKMRSATDEYVVKSVNGRLISTSSVSVDRESVSANNSLLNRTLSEISKTIKPYYNEGTSNYVWQSVPKQHIIDMLQDYIYPVEQNEIFDADSLKRMIEAGGPEMSYWDVGIQHGSSKEFLTLEFTKMLDKKIHLPIRESYISLDHGRAIQFSRRMLASPSNMKEGLYDENGKYSKSKVEELEDEFRRVSSNDKSFSSRTYLNTEDRRPLMLIYPLYVNGEDQEKKRIFSLLDGLPPIGIVLGFPKSENDQEGKDKYIIKYKANSVYAKFGNEDLDFEEA